MSRVGDLTRVAMWLLLAVVAAAAAVLSFSALRDLAVLCGFHDRLAWLLPLVVDAGAAAGCLVWLGRHPGAGRDFARALTWTLLASSVAGNAIVHGLTAYGRPAPWWLVVAVSAVAPAVLGAVVHLAVLVGRTSPSPEAQDPAPEPAPVVVAKPKPKPAAKPEPGLPAEVYQRVTVPDEALTGSGTAEQQRLAALLAEGASDRRIAEALGVSRYRAQQYIASHNGNGAHP